MSRVVALGAASRVEGFALAGVTILPTDGSTAEAAWQELPADTGLVLLTPAARDALDDRLRERPRLLWAVLP